MAFQPPLHARSQPPAEPVGQAPTIHSATGPARVAGSPAPTAGTDAHAQGQALDVGTLAAAPLTTANEAPAHWPGLDEQLAAQLPSFEQFFKTFGFKRLHGRIWGLLVLAGQPLSMREISDYLRLSQGATSTALTELTEWGTISSEFDSPRRCHLHAPVSNTLSIVATVLRRREQVVFQQFKLSATRTLSYVSERYGERDPRVFTLRSIISTCEIAESVMQLVVGAVASALDDSESILSKAIHTALRVGVVGPSRILMGKPRPPVANSAAPRPANLAAGRAPDHAGSETASEPSPRSAPGREAQAEPRPGRGSRRSALARKADRA